MAVKGLILAAGMGKRLKELTQDNTKCMVRVNGQPYIRLAVRDTNDNNCLIAALKELK